MERLIKPRLMHPSTAHYYHVLVAKVLNANSAVLDEQPGFQPQPTDITITRLSNLAWALTGCEPYRPPLSGLRR